MDGGYLDRIGNHDYFYCWLVKFSKTRSSWNLFLRRVRAVFSQCGESLAGYIIFAILVVSNF